MSRLSKLYMLNFKLWQLVVIHITDLNLLNIFEKDLFMVLLSGPLCWLHLNVIGGKKCMLRMTH